MTTPAMINVWDPLVRVFHWSLASAFLLAYLSSESLERLHHFAGYLAISLVLGRLLWGFIGTPYARFRQFVVGPRRALDYLGALGRGQPPRYLGHNPAGALMIVCLLAAVMATGLSGLLLLGIEEHAGMLAVWVHQSGWQDEDVIEDIHEFFANTTLMLVVLHVAGVMVESRRHRDNLVKAMVTGKKSRANHSGETQ